MFSHRSIRKTGQKIRADSFNLLMGNPVNLYIPIHPAVLKEIRVHPRNPNPVAHPFHSIPGAQMIHNPADQSFPCFQILRRGILHRTHGNLTRLLCQQPRHMTEFYHGLRSNGKNKIKNRINILISDPYFSFHISPQHAHIIVQNSLYPNKFISDITNRLRQFLLHTCIQNRSCIAAIDDTPPMPCYSLFSSSQCSQNLN